MALQRDAGRPWAAAAAAWLSFMGWRQACVASHNGDHGTLDILVEVGAAGGAMGGAAAECLPIG